MRFNMKDQMEDLCFTDISALLGSGVYVLGSRDEILYVGRSEHMIRRIVEHKERSPFAFNKVYIFPLDEVDLPTIESLLILRLSPKYNVVSPLSTTLEVYYDGVTGDASFHIESHRAARPLEGNYDMAHRNRINVMLRMLGISDDMFYTFEDVA